MIKKINKMYLKNISDRDYNFFIKPSKHAIVKKGAIFVQYLSQIAPSPYGPSCNLPENKFWLRHWCRLIDIELIDIDEFTYTF